MNQQMVTDRIESLYKGKSTKLQEEQFITLRGNIRDIEIAGVSITFNRKPAVLIIFRDITERKTSPTSTGLQTAHRLQVTSRESLFKLPMGPAWGWL